MLARTGSQLSPKHLSYLAISGEREIAIENWPFISFLSPGMALSSPSTSPDSRVTKTLLPCSESLSMTFISMSRRGSSERRSCCMSSTSEQIRHEGGGGKPTKGKGGARFRACCTVARLGGEVT